MAACAVTGSLVVAGGPASADPPRRIIVSGFVHLLDDETFGTNPTCDFQFFDNDIVSGDQQLVTHEGWGCGGEVYSELYSYADLMPGGAVRYHGKIILHEGTCECASEPARAEGNFNQVVTPEGNSVIDPGYIQWSGGDATSIHLQVYNIA
jgi:hypothetical protein